MKIYASSPTSEFDQFVGQDVWVKVDLSKSALLTVAPYIDHDYIKIVSKNDYGVFSYFVLYSDDMEYLTNPDCYLITEEYDRIQYILDGDGWERHDDLSEYDLHTPLTVFTTTDIQEMLDNADVRRY